MNLTGFWALTEREIKRFFRVWQQTIIPPIITSLLFLLIFGYALGSRIREVDGLPYISFILPGLVMMGILMSAYANTSSSVYISKFQGNIQEWLVAPLSYWQIIFGLTLAAVLRALLVGIGIIVVGLFFASLPFQNILVILYFAVFVSLLFSFAGIATGLWAGNFDQMSVFATFIITPLTYLGGVFYSIQMLPPFWNAIAQFNPIFYMVDGFRYGFLGINDVSLLHSMIIVLVLTLLFFLLCVQLLRKGYKVRS